MHMGEGSIPAGTMTIIVIAAVAVGVGFMTLICTLISAAKNRRRAMRLQSLSPERVISPGACPSLTRRLPSLTGNAGHLVLSFIPASPTSQTSMPPSDRTPKPLTAIEDAPPTYEEALRMAIEESLRHTEHTSESPHATTQITIAEVVQSSVAPAIPPRCVPSMPLPAPQTTAAECSSAINESRISELTMGSSQAQEVPHNEANRENNANGNSTATKGLNDEFDQKDFEDIDLNQ